MGKRKVGALEKVDANLANLQHKIRRDPGSYQADFERQYSQYVGMRGLVEASPTSASDESIVSFRDLIDFISHVADCYPKITAEFPAQLAQLFSQYHEQLESELREKIVGCLVLLRKKELMDSSSLLNTLFPILITTPSKSLRTLLYQKIISDIRSSNSKTTNNKLNRRIQTVLHDLLAADPASPKCIWAVRITRELWRRQIWADSKAVEIMKAAALSDDVKTIVGGVNFFLGGDKEREEKVDEESSGDEQSIDLGKLRHQIGINKKTRKGDKSLKAAAATVKRRERKKNKPHPLNFSALHLLHDPQSFAESLFSHNLQSNRSNLNLEQKLLVLQLVSRLVGLHELTILGLYSYFLKYLTPRQASVTSFLASLAQSVHKRVPPDVIEPLVLKIANEFVSEAASGPVAAVGLNSIREICARQPMAMTDNLLQDLVMYRKSKDKGVMMAAKGLLSLFREVGADKLKKRDRGKDAALGLRSGQLKERRFGYEEAGTIEGLELLEKWREEEKEKKYSEMGVEGDQEVDSDDDDEEAWRAWEIVETDSDDDSGGWIDVQSDGDDIDISDSDDGQPAKKKAKVETAAEAQDGKDIVETLKTAEELSSLATTRILTPADLAKLNELRLQSSVVSKLPANKRRRAQTKAIERHIDDALTAAEIEAPGLLGQKKTKEDKLAAAKADRDESHKSATAKRKEKKREAGKSTTNKEKARKKNFLMTLGKAKGKQKRSLTETRKVLKNHVDRQKRGGRRGNT